MKKKLIFKSPKLIKCIDKVCKNEFERRDLASELDIKHITFDRIYRGYLKPNTQQAWQFIRKFKIKMSDMYGKPPGPNCDWSVIQGMYYPGS